MASNAQRRKEQKKAKRRKRLDKERNQRASRARFRYRLDVKHEGEWKTAKRFRTQAQTQAHLDETEAIRKRGDTEIIEGRVIDLNTLSEKVVARVKAFMPELGPSMEQAARDIRKAAQGAAGPAGDQGAKQSLLEINRESFKKPVGIPLEPAVCGHGNAAEEGSESVL